MSQFLTPSIQNHSKHPSNCSIFSLRTTTNCEKPYYDTWRQFMDHWFNVFYNLARTRIRLTYITKCFWSRFLLQKIRMCSSEGFGIKFFLLYFRENTNCLGMLSVLNAADNKKPNNISTFCKVFVVLCCSVYICVLRTIPAMARPDTATTVIKLNREKHTFSSASACGSYNKRHRRSRRRRI